MHILLLNSQHFFYWFVNFSRITLDLRYYSLSVFSCQLSGCGLSSCLNYILLFEIMELWISRIGVLSFSSFIPYFIEYVINHWKT